MQKLNYRRAVSGFAGLVGALALFVIPSLATAVTIPAGSSIQAAINANPTGTIFNLPAGTRTNQVFTPKQGNQFIGDPAGGTILTGSNTTSRIYGTDGTVNQGVLMKDFTIEHYGVPVAGPALDSGVCGGAAIHGVNGWTFQNMTFRLNNCVGLNMGPNSVVTGGKYIDNGHTGIQGYRAHNIRIESAEIARNNTRRDDPFWDAAGLKIVNTDAMVLRNNYVHDNYGPGLWCDINCRNILFEGNTVIGNYAAGIMYEISIGGTIIRNNVANDNGTTVQWPQIFVASSNGTQVYGNNVRASGNAQGIVMYAENRPDALSTANNSFHNNVITFTTNQNGRYGLANYGGTVGTGNSSNSNTFYVTGLSDPHFYWNTSSPAAFASYRAASGQDAASTIKVGNGSVSGNTQGCPALTGCTPPPPATQSVQTFTLINADTSAGIRQLTNGIILNLATLPTRNLSVRANTTPSTVGSVVFGYDSNPAFRIENIAPYSLTGNPTPTTYAPWTPTVGSHTITATPYTSSGGAGTAGTKLTVNFSVK